MHVCVHFMQLSSLNLEVEGKAFNTHYLARMLLKMVADTLILWRVLYMPTNSDWLVSNVKIIFFRHTQNTNWLPCTYANVNPDLCLIEIV